MLHGFTEDVIHEVEAQSQRWAWEYRETGAFTQPTRMRQVAPGEIMELTSGSLFDVIPRARWRIQIFADTLWGLIQGVPQEQDERMEAVFESFCLNTPWGALHQAVNPTSPRSAERMARRFTALMRFWDVLQGPRYAYSADDTLHTLDSLMARIYHETMEAWCPGGPASVREHLALTVERMTHATREDCLQAILRVIPFVVRTNTDLKHPEVLVDPGFLRESLASLGPKDWEDASSADVYAVNGLLYDWDRALERH